ncbi:MULTISPECIES: envelope stress response membrane protein PspC [unclassified Azospirillum]|uniref:envelope stress response membrane protein PspC n=1 Tax=unclassified Azospirillum TaxID=2630922 RepID=UPI000B72E338|nr:MULTISPECIES: envelope stress response membrane protein PspC [unclassified Azospirillum]SNT06624.1 phage shock protein C (PspC) family protein [Azospirillum sp. RU38E]SNT21596.1 phage shock protein C (PspC) family protein [Azospirillum sp. RU37A]
MSNDHSGYGRGGDYPPPPGSGRRRYRANRQGQKDWQYELLGKRPEQSWGEYLGIDPGRYGRRRKGGSAYVYDSGVYSRSAEQEQEQEEAMEPINTRSPNPHKLYRSRTDAKLGGVCAGIADYLNVDSWIVRLVFVIGFFCFPPVFLFGYPILWWILKPQPMGLYESQEEEVFWRSVATKPEQTLSALRNKFRQLDQEIGRLEGFVASREYDLHRQFRDLERK